MHIQSEMSSCNLLWGCNLWRDIAPWCTEGSSSIVSTLLVQGRMQWQPLLRNVMECNPTQICHNLQPQKWSASFRLSSSLESKVLLLWVTLQVFLLLRPPCVCLHYMETMNIQLKKRSSIWNISIVRHTNRKRADSLAWDTSVCSLQLMNFLFPSPRRSFRSSQETGNCQKVLNVTLHHTKDEDFICVPIFIRYGYFFYYIFLQKCKLIIFCSPLPVITD